jgi:hypothetical protein
MDEKTREIGKEEDEKKMKIGTQNRNLKGLKE